MEKQVFEVGDKLLCKNSTAWGNFFKKGKKYEITQILEVGDIDITNYGYVFKADNDIVTEYWLFSSIDMIFDITLFERKHKLKKLETIN